MWGPAVDFSLPFVLQSDVLDSELCDVLSQIVEGEGTVKTE